jgi:uncharacterized membrane protein
MESSGESGNRSRGRGRRPNGETQPDAAAIATIALRLDALDGSMADVNRRLRTIEERLRITAPAPAVAAPQPPVAPPVPAAQRAQPAPAPAPVTGDAGLTFPSVRTLLDGEPRRSKDAQPAPIPALPKPVVVRPRTALSLADLERAVSGRGLAWAGGLTLLIGALFFFSLAISRGWIGPEMRVVIGIVAGLVVTGLGDRLMRGGDRVLGPVLVAVGIGVWNLALVAGTRLYDFVPTPAALLGAAAGAVVATSIAIRANAQIIALYGMMTALAAPMLFAVPSAQVSMAYLVIILLGSTTVSIARGWTWLPPVAFLLSEVQFWGWWRSAEAPQWMTVLAIGTLTLLHLGAATGADLRARTRGAQVSAFLLLLVNAVAFATVGFGTLGEEELRLGAFLLGGAAAHAAAGVTVRQRRGEATAFSYGAFAIAVILFTTAIPVVFDGPPVAVAWAAEAVGLVWLAHRFRSADGFWAAAMVYALAIAHLFAEEYGAVRGQTPVAGEGIPFANVDGLTLLGLLAALAAAGAIVRERLPRVVFAMIGFGIVIAALPFELSGLTLLTGWALLAVLALAAGRLLSTLPDGVPGNSDLAWVATYGMHVPAAVAAGLAIGQAVLFEMPIASLAQIGAGTFSAEPVIAAGVIVVAALAATWVTKSDEVRQIAGSAAILVLANLAAYLLDPAPAVAAWSALAVAAAFLQRRSEGRLPILLLTSGALLMLGGAVTLAVTAPVTRLLVTAHATADHPFFWSGATLALGALAAACFLIARLLRVASVAVWVAVAGGVFALYGLSVGIVDTFQTRVDGVASVAELRWQSQMALSVVWAVLGGVAVAAGLIRDVATLRVFGLGLLALTTVKVFLYDLSSLDAVYRVLSFIVLGILLLLSAYAYRRFGAAPDDDLDATGRVTSAGASAEPG